MENINEQIQAPAGRPKLLTVLVVLSLVSIIFNLIFTIFFLFRGPISESQLKLDQDENAKLIESMSQSGMPSLAELFEKIGRMEVYVNNNWFMHHFATFLMLTVGLIGVIKMSKGKIIGFHLYIIYSILTSAIIYVSVPFAEVAVSELIVGLLFSFLFIWLYSRNLGYLKK